MTSTTVAVRDANEFDELANHQYDLECALAYLIDAMSVLIVEPTYLLDEVRRAYPNIWERVTETYRDTLLCGHEQRVS